ncbi:ABC transporter ATP-binding protein [Phreatobacter cathodiphilus]|uniref:ABC transporter ATP-binding protein n=1 Tax=Phreatobacter cathodiphilus TaxID=1868589 RepID=UPI001C06F582|nr:ATP-binding cassette domain-containing protein [Phreatobacter cathodiphilus]
MSEGGDSSEGAGGGFVLDGACLSAEGRRIVGPISLSLTRGRVYGLIGHNGSGKSSLMRMLARQAEPDEGAISFDGQPLVALGGRAFARKVAYLPQILSTGAGLTVRELAGFGRYPWHGPLGRPSATDAALVDEAVALTGLGAHADRPADSLSGGERQRAWLAMLLAQRAEFMLLDEPTAALDVAQQIDILGLIRGLSRIRACGVLIIIHDINMAARFADEIIALRGGRVAAAGPPEAIMTEATLEAIYGVPMHVLRHPGAGWPVGLPH